MQQDLSVSTAWLLEGLGSAMLAGAGNPLLRGGDEHGLAFILVSAWPESCHPLGIAAPHIKEMVREVGDSVVEYM